MNTLNPQGQAASQIAAVDLMQGISPENLSKLIGALRIRHFDPGQMIVSFQDPTRDVYLILDGTVRVT